VAAHIRKGDTIVVVAGKEKGKRGKVLRLLTKKDRVIIERLALVKRHTKPSQRSSQGGIVEKEGSIAISNVRLWCTKCDAPRRSRIDESNGAKNRVCTKCGTAIESPAA
jgi:large subunit ribosomal protein L24